VRAHTMGLLCEHVWHVLMGDALCKCCTPATDDQHAPLNLPHAAIGVPSHMALSAFFPQCGRQGKPHDRFVVVQGPPFVMGWAAKPGAKPSQTGASPEGHSCLAALCGGPFELPSCLHGWRRHSWLVFSVVRLLDGSPSSGVRNR